MPYIERECARGTRLYAIALAILVVFAAKGFGTFGQDAIMNWVGLRIIADFQIRMFAHLMRADLVFFHDNHAGGLRHYCHGHIGLRVVIFDAGSEIYSRSLIHG